MIGGVSLQPPERSIRAIKNKLRTLNDDHTEIFHVFEMQNRMSEFDHHRGDGSNPCSGLNFSGQFLAAA